MERVVQIFKALSDETRLKILIIVSRRRICSKGIAKHLCISEAAVSQHLKVLRESGIIVGEKAGYFVHYYLQEPVLADLISFINQLKDDRINNCCKLGVNIPNDCKAACKQDKAKCCQKNEHPHVNNHHDCGH